MKIDYNKHISWRELVDIFRQYNKENNITSNGVSNPLFGIVVFSQDSYSKPYTEKERSYVIRSDAKYFLDGMISASIWGDCLDGIDVGVKLSAYMEECTGDKHGWKVEYCYIEKPTTNECFDVTSKKQRYILPQNVEAKSEETAYKEIYGLTKGFIYDALLDFKRIEVSDEVINQLRKYYNKVEKQPTGVLGVSEAKEYVRSIHRDMKKKNGEEVANTDYDLFNTYVIYNISEEQLNEGLKKLRFSED